MNVPAAGLTAAEARAVLAEVGRNEIHRAAATSGWRLLVRQFASPLIWLLFLACAMALVLGEVVDAVAIAAVVTINGAVGFLQERRADTALAALRSLTAPRAQVLRDGRRTEVPAAEVVPGDALVLEAGEVVAADARLVEAHALATNEAPLTGESAPSSKRLEPTGDGAPLAERHDRVFMGTSVVRGSGLATVVSTGMKSELGRIAHLLATAEETETPLQRRLARVSRMLLQLCLGVVAVTAAIGLLRGLAPLTVVLSAVSLAVAAVPEGLPAIVTIALAIGVQRMAARHVLVRRLPAVETLGSATVICTDKTGTLTTGVMAVRELWGPDHGAVLRTAAACCDAELGLDERGGSGDPTEVALLMAAAARGIRRATIEAASPRRHVSPFDPERKRMSIFRADGVLYLKGAPEAVLPICSSAPSGADQAGPEMAARGLRVLAVAVGPGPEEEALSLVGLVGIADPPRNEAIEAVRSARQAGIQVVMITGDHPATARAIAEELGLVRAGDDAAELVHPRATPEDKLLIVRRWKEKGAVVAMTGDGVNDAPALREAHIGIAMGRTGTEVTREASDIVLSDDNFASIVAAIREGRGIFENIRKTLAYLLIGNGAELLVMLGSSVAGLPLPLLPLHLLWINLVTDGLPALALVMDPSDPDIMSRPPRRPDEPMLGRREWGQIALVGTLEAAVVLGVFRWALGRGELDEARYLAFSTLVFSELFRAFAARSARRVLWEIGPLSNLRLVAVVVLSASIQLVIPYLPVTERLFRIRALGIEELAVAVGVGLVPVTLMELAKLARRLVRRARGATA
jgi:Ca2+-transporting ATPase